MPLESRIHPASFDQKIVFCPPFFSRFGNLWPDLVALCSKVDFPRKRSLTTPNENPFDATMMFACS